MAHPQSPSFSGLSYAVRSDVGLRRKNNQDSYAVAPASTTEGWQTRGHLFLVADGMGAHAAGELASKLAADTIPQSYRKHAELAPADALLIAIEEANRVIHHRGQANAEFHGMGTTASVLLLLPQGAFVGHVGDSRVYRLRGTELVQLTFDHSLVWEMMSSSNIGEAQVPAHFPKNIITRSLGPSPSVEIDREGPFPIQPGDTFLLCSDGLSGQIADEEIGQILVTLPPEEAAQAMVDLANLRGGPDNITVIVVRAENTNPIQPDERNEVESLRAPLGTRGWVLLTFAAIGLLAALAFTAAQLWIAACIVFGATLVSTLAALLTGRKSPLPVKDLSDVHYGKGPHRNFSCTPSKTFSDQLAEIVLQLDQAAQDENWPIDWDRFRGFEKEAQAAREGRHYGASVRGYCHAMTFLMDELRQHRSQQSASEPPR